MPKKKTSPPSFSTTSDLARYIDPVHRQKRNRISSAAFIRNPGPPKEAYLSVNSTEIEGLDKIATYYRKLFNQGSKKVAVGINKIREHNSAAKKATVLISFKKSEKKWVYKNDDSIEDAYKHRPGRSISHCGIEFVKSFSDLTERKYARQIAKKKYSLH